MLVPACIYVELLICVCVYWNHLSCLQTIEWVSVLSTVYARHVWDHYSNTSQSWYLNLFYKARFVHKGIKMTFFYCDWVSNNNLNIYIVILDH